MRGQLAGNGEVGAAVPTVVFTRRIRDLFAKRYWVLCWKCDLRLGPFPDRGFALFVQVDIDSDPGAGVDGD